MSLFYRTTKFVPIQIYFATIEYTKNTGSTLITANFPNVINGYIGFLYVYNGHFIVKLEQNFDGYIFFIFICTFYWTVFLAYDSNSVKNSSFFELYILTITIIFPKSKVTEILLYGR